MRMKKGIWLTLLTLLIFSGVGSIKTEAIIKKTNKSVAIDKKTISKKIEWSPLDNLPVVVHGLGYIDGHMVTNSLDALLLNYNRGFRVFEIDLNMTSDHRLVARHDWTPGHYAYLGQDYPPVAGPIPFQTVMSLRIHGKYNPASREQILAVMQMYPDIYIITDTKEINERNVRSTFSYLVNAVKQFDPTLLGRIIPQIYDTKMLSYIKSYYDFKYVIYTLYQLTNIPSPDELADWSMRNNITAITAFPFRLTAEMRSALQEKGIIVYAHTINDPNEAARYKQKGIGIYTDYLLFNGMNFVGPTQSKQ
jgi:glycerophosphoryl diester phosphodiesterase